jgi:hypothetical protein
MKEKHDDVVSAVKKIGNIIGSKTFLPRSKSIGSYKQTHSIVNACLKHIGLVIVKTRNRNHWEINKLKD